MSRCDLNTYGECSCIASGIPCRAQIIDLGTFVGTNHPDAFEILGEANNSAAKYGPALIVLLASIVFAIIIGLGASVGPANI
jgi:hypothetical protein